jgi:hypothetical protein
MSDQPPRSAFEIAMERLRQQDVDEAKLAQAEVMHGSELARTADSEGRAALQKTYQYSRERLVSERDAKIDRIRSGEGDR